MTNIDCEVFELEMGNRVLCDFCGKEFTDSDEKGGLLFQSKATGPCCNDRIRELARVHNEEFLIHQYCPDTMAFADWVRDHLR